MQGNAPASTDLFRAIAVGCLKVFPNAQVDPAQFAGRDESVLFDSFSDPAFIALVARRRHDRAAGSRPPDRRKAEYRR